MAKQVNEGSFADALESLFDIQETLDLTLSECVRPVAVISSPSQADTKVVEATIDVSEDDDLSSEIDLGGYRLAAIYMPEDWTAADIGFEVAREAEGVYQTLYDDAGSAVTLTVDAGRVVGVNDAAGALAPCRFVKLSTSVSQGADRTLFLLLKK